MPTLRTRSGTVVTVSDEQAARLRVRGWTDADQPRTEEPSTVEADDVEDPPPSDVCADCGFQAKSPRGLAVHRRTHS
jgi:hypothetical protein